MKTLIKILLLGGFMALASCHKEIMDRPRSSYLVEIRFVDEVGNNLLSRVHLRESISGAFFLDNTQYSLEGWRNGVYVKPKSPAISMPAFPKSSMILLDYNFDIEVFSDSIVNYKLEFTCPELFGDDLVHTIVIEKKAKNWGYLNNFERLLFDGEVIATNMEGDSSDNDRLPVVIVVPQK